MRTSFVTAALAAVTAASVQSSLQPNDERQLIDPEAEPEANRLDAEPFFNMIQATLDLQTHYFAHWVGVWPDGIDWTQAVMASHLISVARSILEAVLDSSPSQTVEDPAGQSYLIFRFLTEIIAFYFNQDFLSIRNQAYDDMLWVVLNWLDAVKLIVQIDERGQEMFANSSYKSYWGLWVPAFSHRARVFWELASAGWDYTLCNGGMIWSSGKLPYKNAITNQLFVTGSLAMYRHFPGDDNASPFNKSNSHKPSKYRENEAPKWPAGDTKYLDAAVEAYNWLDRSNMTNRQGLYTDGFHISGYGKVGHNNTKCDERDESVFTYNQGVILSGLRHLFAVEGRRKYLNQGHDLIHAVIRATGWDLKKQRPKDRLNEMEAELPPWHGLGRLGILEEDCDASGRCSQDGQTFKGIWMHHFTEFCQPLTEDERTGFKAKLLPNDHNKKCREYLMWLRHNADAAWKTRDSEGRFGMWWTVGLLPRKVAPGTQKPLAGEAAGQMDPNNRGRGRTLETQGSGVALMRAYWELWRRS